MGPRAEVTRDNSSSLDPFYGMYNSTFFVGLLTIVYFYPKLDYNLLKGRGQVCCSVLSGVCHNQRYSNSLDNKGMTE